MKKLFEKPLFHYTFVLTVVAIVCGIMIGAVNAVTAPIIEENIRKAQAEAYSRVLTGLVSYEDLEAHVNDPSTIVGKVRGLDASNNELGYIYTAYATNKFGYMRIVVAVNAAGTILGADFIEINQTYQVDGTRTNLSRYVGSSIGALAPQGDLVSGATGSLNTVKAMLGDVAIAHANTVVAPADPYVSWFGAGYTKVADSGFTPAGFVLEKDIVSNAEGQVIGSFYKVRGIGTYNDSGSSGAITLYVGILTDGTIVGIDMPRAEYGHTTSAIFLPKVQAYVASIVGSNITSFTGQGDLAAGASYSKAHVDALLDAIGGIFE